MREKQRESKHLNSKHFNHFGAKKSAKVFFFCFFVLNFNRKIQFVFHSVEQLVIHSLRLCKWQIHPSRTRKCVYKFVCVRAKTFINRQWKNKRRSKDVRSEEFKCNDINETKWNEPKQTESISIHCAKVWIVQMFDTHGEKAIESNLTENALDFDCHIMSISSERALIELKSRIFSWKLFIYQVLNNRVPNYRLKMNTNLNQVLNRKIYPNFT